MSQTQRIIKYLAIAFAVFLIFNIFSGIFYGLNSLNNIFSNESIKDKLQTVDINDASILNIDLKSANLTFKIGSNLYAETNNNDIIIKQENNKIYVTEKKYNWFNKDASNLIIYIPNDLVFDGVLLNTGAGKVNIENLIANKLYLDLGTGKVQIDNLTVNNNAEIDGGAGEITINKSNINNLNLDLGVGKLVLNTKLTGKNEIDLGIGDVNINLDGSIHDYKISVDKGFGKSIIDGKTIVEGSYGSGNNYIEIDGGIGNIDVSLNK